jgi:hypothetical protein
MMTLKMANLFCLPANYIYILVGGAAKSLVWNTKIIYIVLCNAMKILKIAGLLCLPINHYVQSCADNAEIPLL